MQILGMTTLLFAPRRARDVPLRLIAYVGVLGLSATALATGFVVTGWELGTLWTVLVLALAAAAAERASVQLVRGVAMESSISNLLVLLGAVLFGPLAAMLIGATSMLGAFRRPRLKWATYTLTRTINGALTGVVASQAASLAVSDIGSIAVSAICGGAAVEFIDLGFVSLTYRLRGNRVRPLVGALLPVTLSSVPLYMPLVALLAIAFEKVSPFTLPLFLAPALAFHKLFALYQDQRRLADDLGIVNQRLERANLSFATALVATLDARDRYTAGHSAAVAIYARDIAERLGLPEEQRQLAHQCGLVHDIGKIGLPAGLLEKPGALTLEERRQMQEHSAIGERILAKVEDYAEIANIVRHHHERMDGMGYPDGVAGEEIPFLSRIIAVADAYNAMTSDRPYRDAMPSRVARMRLAQGVEGQFDTAIVAAFEAILAGADEEYRTAKRADFTLDAQDQYSESASEVAA
jgi:putative nucleotidyltransferase with HDIG domain